MPGPGALGPGTPRGRVRPRHLPEHRRTVGVNDPDSATAGTAGKQPVPPRPGSCRGAGREGRPPRSGRPRSARPRSGRPRSARPRSGRPMRASPHVRSHGSRVQPGSGAAAGPVSPRGHRRLSRPDLAQTRSAGPFVAAPSGTSPGWRARAVPRARCFHGTLTALRSSIALDGVVAWSRRRSWVLPVRSSAPVSRAPSRPWPPPRSAKQMVDGCGRGTGRSGVLVIARGTSSAAGIRPCTGGSLRGREGEACAGPPERRGRSRRAVGPGGWSALPASLPPALRPSGPRGARSVCRGPRGVLRVSGPRFSGACFCRWGWIAAGREWAS